MRGIAAFLALSLAGSGYAASSIRDDLGETEIEFACGGGGVCTATWTVAGACAKPDIAILYNAPAAMGILRGKCATEQGVAKLRLTEEGDLTVVVATLFQSRQSLGMAWVPNAEKHRFVTFSSSEKALKALVNDPEWLAYFRGGNDA